MAKRREDIENPILTQIIPLRRPSIEETSKLEERAKREAGVRCECCNERVYTMMDDHVIVDTMYFCDDHCVTDYFIKEAGGRRVYGGAC